MRTEKQNTQRPADHYTPHGKYITGTVRAFHEEERTVHSCGESRETRAIQDRVPERVCRFEACQEYQPHTPLPQPQHSGARDDTAPHRTDADGGATQPLDVLASRPRPRFVVRHVRTSLALPISVGLF